MKIVIEPITQAAPVIALLDRCGLPSGDVRPSAAMVFFGCRIRRELAGVVGLELYGTEALLRSLAVAPAYRHVGMGKALVAYAEAAATGRGVSDLYLLTTTAAPFFARLGYQPLPRAEAPEAIRTTAQFSGLCPASSTFMGKRMETRAVQ